MAFCVDPYETRGAFGCRKKGERAVVRRAQDAELLRLHVGDIAEGKRGGLAADGERIGIEALRHQHRAARDDDAVGRDEDGVRSVGDDLLVQLAVERAGHELIAGTVEKALAVRKKPWPAVPDLFAFKRSDTLGTTAAGGDAIELARDGRREDDHTVAIPCAAAAGRGVA